MTTRHRGNTPRIIVRDNPGLAACPDGWQTVYNQSCTLSAYVPRASEVVVPIGVTVAMECYPDAMSPSQRVRFIGGSRIKIIREGSPREICVVEVSHP